MRRCNIPSNPPSPNGIVSTISENWITCFPHNVFMRKKHTGTLSLKGVGADDDLKKYIGRQIASIRKGSDLTARQVAERLKVSRETLTQIETGRNNPTALMLWKLACLFQCEVSDFFPQIPEGF